MFLQSDKKLSKLEVGLVKKLIFKKELQAINNINPDNVKLPISSYDIGYGLNRSYRIYEIIRLHRINKIYELTGITLLDFLNLTQLEIDMIITDAQQYKDTKEKVINDVMRDLEA